MLVFSAQVSECKGSGRGERVSAWTSYRLILIFRTREVFLSCCLCHRSDKSPTNPSPAAAAVAVTHLEEDYYGNRLPVATGYHLLRAESEPRVTKASEGVRSASSDTRQPAEAAAVEREDAARLSAKEEERAEAAGSARMETRG